MPDEIGSARARIAEVGRLLYQRRLTDTAGGNISARVSDCICMTPKYAGGHCHWDLRPDQVLVLALDGRKLEGEGEISREALVHLRLYQQFAAAGAVVHCHAPNTLVFGAVGIPVPPILEYVQRLGPVGIARYAPTHSALLAESVATALGGRGGPPPPPALAAFGGQRTPDAAATIVPGHGLFVVARDLDTAFDVSERIEITARTVLLGSLLAGGKAWIAGAQAELAAGRATGESIG
jgi:L-fuculose-phosphate aldolase